MATYLDESFNWLVVLLGTISATLCQFPELLPLFREGIEGVTLVVRSLVFPLLVLVVLWLAGSLAREPGSQVVLKGLSWIYAFIILASDIVLLLFGTVPTLRSALGRGQLGILQTTLPLQLAIPIPLALFVIRPRMREVYKDSTFLYSLLKQAIVYLLAVTLYLLAIGFIENLMGLPPF